jgi:hypothetical protein
VAVPRKRVREAVDTPQEHYWRINNQFDRRATAK